MRIKMALSLAVVLLLLNGCAQPETQTQSSKYEGYIDETVIAPSSAEQEPVETAPVESETPSVPVEDVITSTLSPSENTPSNTPSAEDPAATTPAESETPAAPPAVSDPIGSEAAALSKSPAAVTDILTAKASGVRVHQAERAVIDYSNTKDGYVMIQFTGQTDKRLKSQVKGPSTTYTYNLTVGMWEVFPLSDGNGSYQVTVFENVADSKYAAVTSVTFDVKLTDEFAPYLLPNQYVNYSPTSKTVATAASLIGHETDALKKVTLVYDYVVNTLTYDEQKAATVKSGYLPVLDTVLAEKRGICFDYAALMAAMLRSQGVPCKLVVGYAGTTYHAWINVWSEDTGWIDGVIFFDGTSWQRMDPTFASSGKKSESIMKYIGDGTNYTAKYLY